MFFLKKVNALFLGLAVLLAVGCGKDDKQGNPDPAVSKKNCQLIKSTSFDAGGLGSQYSTNEISLNGNRQIIESIYKVSKDGVIYQTIERKTYFYNALGNLSKTVYYPSTDPNPIYFDKYKYNAGSQLSSIEIYTIQYNHSPVDTVLSNIESFEYYPDNQVKRHYLSPTLDYFHEYTYPNANKAIRTTAYWDAAANQLKTQQIDEIEFDSKKSLNVFPYLRMSNAYVIGINGGLDFGHNVISLKATNYSFNNQTVIHTSYQYNADDYPISWSRTDSLGNVKGYGTYDYSCQ